MDDRIIDFNELKNKAKDEDVYKFEQYIYSLYYSLAQGEITMGDFSKKVMEYMESNNISHEKFFNIQREFMKKYGFDMDNISDEMKKMGIDIPNLDPKVEYENARKFMSFEEKYKGRLANNMVTTYFIKNDTNNLEAILTKENIILKSEKLIDLNDSELNEFLCSYKKVMEDIPLNICICENTKSYNY